MQTISLFAPLKVSKQYSLAHGQISFPPPSPLGEGERASGCCILTKSVVETGSFFIPPPPLLLPNTSSRAKVKKGVFGSIAKKFHHLSALKT
jgi:hypothetical protein